MEIKTKFDRNQEVWAVFGYKGHCPTCNEFGFEAARVERCIISGIVFDSNMNGIYYYLVNNNQQMAQESQLFATEQEAQAEADRRNKVKKEGA